MVYYGKISRGCQRCRQRKIKCDQRKPGCSNCAKSARQCPGYRNLNEILFRDESKRIIRKAHRKELKDTVGPACTEKEKESVNACALTLSLPRPLLQPTKDLGATFFFTKYVPRETDVSRNFHDWLCKSYASASCSQALQATIQAVGAAGIFNISPSQGLALESQQWHCQALSDLKRVIADPVQANSDATLTAVILLALYETVTFNLKEARQSRIHVDGAIALLESRGLEQFTRERGAHLLGQVYTRMLPICLQEGLPVPPGLVRVTYNYQSSALKQEYYRQQQTHPGSLAVIAIHLINLHAKIKNGTLTDYAIIRKLALEIDRDLEAWESWTPPSYRYTVVEVTESEEQSPYTFSTEFLGGKRFLYPNQRIAEIWNNLRIQRIAIKQILLRNERKAARFGISDKECVDSAERVIRRNSVEICASIDWLIGSPRSMSVIEPLYTIAVEELNPLDLRLFAIHRLKKMGSSMGVRQAGLLAEQALQALCLTSRGDEGVSASIY